MLRLVKAGLVGGILLFAWYTISWTVMDWHQKSFSSIPNGEIIIQNILDAHQSNGSSFEQKIYIAPKVVDMKSKTNTNSKSAFAFIALSPNGLKPMNNQILFSFMTQTLLAFLMSLIIIIVDSFKFWKSYLIVVLTSVLFAVGYSLPSNNWWGFSWDYLKVDALDLIIAWSIAGIAIAYFAKRKD